MSDTLARVQRVFATVFPVKAEEVLPEHGPGDVRRWDSLGHLNLVAALEREFRIALDIDEVMEIATVAKCIEVIEKARAA